MKKILRITLLMLFCMMAIPLTHAGDFPYVGSGGFNAPCKIVAQTSDETKGLVYAQFAETRCELHMVNPQNFWRYLHTKPANEPTSEDFKSSVEQVYDITGSQISKEAIEQQIYLYAKPAVGYELDHWEIKETSDQKNDYKGAYSGDPIQFDTEEQIVTWIYSRVSMSYVRTLEATAYFRKVAVEPTEPQVPEGTKIQGYFRIQNVGNEKYVEVTGPFTAAPNKSLEAAQNSAGTVMYVEAVADGPSYRLTHLRSQGIDVVGDEDVFKDDITEILSGIEVDASNIFNDLAYALVRKGFTYGYTNVGRATVGAVFLAVASVLDNYGKEHGKIDGVDYAYSEDDYVNVAKDFNDNVTRTLDLGIRLKPVDYDNIKNQTVQVYFDVPSLEPVCKWYLDEKATLESGANRHDVFASAMKAMSWYMRNYKLETFYSDDVTLLENWGYKFPSEYEKYKEDGNYNLTFDLIFSDEVLLFNWIKMVGYYLLNPGEDLTHGIAGFFGDRDMNLADAAKGHYLTELFVDYLPRIHHNSRAYLINGRVGDDNNSKDGTLGFASRGELAEAGDNANWKLCAIDNKEQKFVVSHKHKAAEKTTTNGTETFGASALYFDFPVEVPENSGTSLLTMDSKLYKTTIGNTAYTFAMVTPLPGTVAAKTPFLMKSTEGTAQLIIPNDNCVFADKAADNGVAALNDDEQDKALQPNSMMGVLLRTSLEGDNFKNLWDGDVEDIYTLNQYLGDYSNMMFNEPGETKSLNANEAVYIISSKPEPTELDAEFVLASLNEKFVYIGLPEEVEVPQPEVPAVTKIKGYFRIQNVGNEKYVEVTGPFTARPDNDEKAAKASAGTIMYVEAVQDGNADSYRLTHLRSQGIDVVGDEDVFGDDITSILNGIELDASDIFGDLAYTLVRKGFTYGYTNVGRATVGAVFMIVASALDRYGEQYGQLESFVKGDYAEVAKDFNREVSAKLDLGIRLNPVSFGEKIMQVYFDVPSLKPVCDWYLNMDAKLYAGTDREVSRHDVFASAMKAMSWYTKENRKINLETFTQADIDLFNSWGYNIEEKYAGKKNGGNIELEFNDIFSDEVLLFNWIKMVGYYILNPGDNDHNLSSLGFEDLAEKAQSHYLTGLLVDYLPRIHHNSRAYLINGRVGDDNKSKDGTLGFASRGELDKAGDNANWKLVPVDNKTNVFEPEILLVADKKEGDVKNTYSYHGFYFDFPVSAVDNKTKFYTITDRKYFSDKTEDGKKIEAHYTTLDEITGVVPAQTAFIVEHVDEDADRVLLNVADGDYMFDALSEGSELAAQHMPRFRAEAEGDVTEGDDSESVSSPLLGVLLPTSMTDNSLENYWGIDKDDVYPLTTTEGKMSKTTYLTFATVSGKTQLNANEIAYSVKNDDSAPDAPIQDTLYIGEPEVEDVEPTPTAVDDIIANGAETDNNFYDLRGIKVDKPQPGAIYIHKGKKVLVF